MRGGVGRASADAGRTEATSLARERDPPIVAAVGAKYAHEAVAEQTALQVRAQLARDETRHHAHVLKCGPKSWRTKLSITAALQEASPNRE